MSGRAVTDAELMTELGPVVRRLYDAAYAEGRHKDEAHANAILLAAPDLLDACNAALAALVGQYGQHAENPLPALLRAAIRKAEGK